jgi:serine/threonine protein kinase
MSRRLFVLKGPDQGKHFLLQDAAGMLLGRGRHVDSQLNDLRVSRVHCEVEALKGGRVLLTDLDSGGGTFVNGQRIHEHYLKHGDVIRIGDSELRLVDEDGTQETLPPVNAPKPRQTVLTAERLGELKGKRLSHYDVGAVLAKGLSGLVFQAHDFKSDRQVAFKVLWPEVSRDDDEMRRFVRAMKTMLPLCHPNLVTLHGAGKSGPYCWIAMELVPAESLAQFIQRMGTAGMLDWRKALQIAFHLALVLDYLHGQSVIHRNLTPTNILVGKTPAETKLGDLVLAKAIEGNLAQQITRPGEIIGDVRFMAPERASGGAAAADARTDLYSLGALTYTLLTGRPPLSGSNLVETLTKIQHEVPERPRKVHMGIPELFEDMVLRLLAKRPEDRYATAAVLLKDLERVAKFQSIPLAAAKSPPQP